jgi:hypothetical protein
VDSPSWLQQYQFFTPEILRRVNTPPLEEPITTVRFSLGKIGDSAYLSGGGEAEVRERYPAISSEDIAALEKTVRALSPELSNSIRPLIEDWIAWHRPVQDEEQQDES